MNISIIGTGYVGLVSGVCLAEKGHNVVCVDIDKEKVEMINNGVPPIHEQNLEELLVKNIGSNFTATTDLQQAVSDSELSIIAVGTPFDGELIDLTFIEQVSAQIGKILRHKDKYHVVAVKSTVVPGTTDDVVLPILESESGKTAGIHFGVGMNPEFLREGEAISDFMNPDRIVLGGIDSKTRDIMSGVYEVFEHADIIKTNNKTAEMIKYTSNSLLATLISFSNEIGNLCAGLEDVDVLDVMEGVHKDKRFSPVTSDGERIVPGFLSYLAAGCGFGGSCFPKDVKALIAHGQRSGNPMSLLNAVIQINDNQPKQIINAVDRCFNNLSGKKIGILGLAFKPGTDDMRESPSIPVVRYLLESGVIIKAYDPVAESEARKLFGNQSIFYMDNLIETLDDVEAIILLTGWKEFEHVPEIIKNKNPQPLFIDGRRMLSKHSFEKYIGIGLS
jgi:UDPglucose 6-dehydrogenase